MTAQTTRGRTAPEVDGEEAPAPSIRLRRWIILLAAAPLLLGS
jgi:hypothetical protein